MQRDFWRGEHRAQTIVAERDRYGAVAVGAPTTAPHLFLAACLQSLRRFDEAEAVLRQAQEEIDRTGQDVQAANLAFVRAYMRLSAGRLDDAATEARAGLATAEEPGGPPSRHRPSRPGTRGL